MFIIIIISNLRENILPFMLQAIDRATGYDSYQSNMYRYFAYSLNTVRALLPFAISIFTIMIIRYVAKDD